VIRRVVDQSIDRVSQLKASMMACLLVVGDRTLTPSTRDVQLLPPPRCCYALILAITVAVHYLLLARVDTLFDSVPLPDALHSDDA